MKFENKALTTPSGRVPRLAASYTRSAVLQEGQPPQTPISNDITEANAWAATHGVTLVQSFTDGPGSGRSVSNKPGFLAMMEAAERREFDVVLLRDLSRIARDPWVVVHCIRRLEELGVAVWQLALGEFVDQNATFRLMFSASMTDDHSRRPCEGTARTKAVVKNAPLDVTLDTLAELDQLPGWDIVPHVQFSAAYKYDHSLGVKKYVVYGRDAFDVGGGAALEENHTRRCYSLGQKEGWRCAGTYADLGVGDGGKIGPALKKLLDRIRRGDVAYVIVGDLSHLSRDPISIQDITDTLAAAGTTLAVAHDYIKGP